MLFFLKYSLTLFSQGNEKTCCVSHACVSDNAYVSIHVFENVFSG
jgi:hypothetical protein